MKSVTVLQNLDNADDMALLASRHSNIQDKTSHPRDIGKAVGLKINPRKPKTMRLNCKNNVLINVGGRRY